MTNALRQIGPVSAWVLAVVLAAAAAPAAAQIALDWLRDTPSEKFNEEDVRLFREATRKAVTEVPVGETVKWSNPATQSHGELKVLKEFTWKDNACRQLRVSNEAKGRKASNPFNLCLVSGKWRIVSPSELEKR